MNTIFFLPFTFKCIFSIPIFAENDSFLSSPFTSMVSSDTCHLNIDELTKSSQSSAKIMKLMFDEHVQTFYIFIPYN